MIWFVIGLLIIGLTAGAVASIRVPDADTMRFGTTALLGVFGAFVGGSMGWVLFGTSYSPSGIQISGLVGAAVGAALILLAWRAVTVRRIVRR